MDGSSRSGEVGGSGRRRGGRGEGGRGGGDREEE